MHTEVDYMFLEKTLRESKATLRHLLNENRYLWNRPDKIEEILADRGISIVDI